MNGRRIEPTYEAVSPIGDTSANQACVKLTEDQPVFIAMGYFQADQVLCYVDTHATAVIGGTMTPERQAKAKAPWYTGEPSADLEADAIRAFAQDGALDGTLGVRRFDDWQARGITSVLHEKKGGYANNTASIYGLAKKAENEGVRLLTALMGRAGSVEVRPMTSVAEGLSYESPRGTVELRDRHLRQRVFLAVADGLSWDVIQQL